MGHLFEDPKEITPTKCEKCGRIASCEEIPRMGYSQWLCEGCYHAMIISGEIGE